MRKYLIIFTFFSISLSVSSQQQVVPYTLADRDRLIQVEASVGSPAQ